MNHTDEIELLRSLGPAATRLDPAAREQARTALLAGIAEERGARPLQPSRPLRPGRRGTGRRVLAAGSLAAAVAAIALLAPSLLGRGETALARIDPLTFPVTPTSLPADLGDPVFELDPGFALARYGNGGATLTVIAPDSMEHWTVPADAGHVALGARDALAFSTAAHTFTLAWEEADGQVLGVTGRGPYADPSTVEEVARSLVERAQRVPLSLTLAPRGWQVSAYHSNRTVEYSGDGRRLTVSLLPRLSSDLDDYGVTDVSKVQVNGEDALLGRQSDDWVLEGRTSDGQAFSLLAPSSLTREQVVDVASGVRHRD